jgi:transposase-like protein
MAIGRRVPSGHRVGAWHHRSKYPAETVREALRLHSQGLGCERIGAALGVPWRTVSDWLSGATRWADVIHHG